MTPHRCGPPCVAFPPTAHDHHTIHSDADGVRASPTILSSYPASKKGLQRSSHKTPKKKKISGLGPEFWGHTDKTQRHQHPARPEQTVGAMDWSPPNPRVVGSVSQNPVSQICEPIPRRRVQGQKASKWLGQVKTL